MFKLIAELGDIRLGENLYERGSGNSTRWIIQVEQNDSLPGSIVSTRFELVRRKIQVVPSVYTFSFGAQDEGMYAARPTLVCADGFFTLRARCVETRYLLSIDILHSLYR